MSDRQNRGTLVALEICINIVLKIDIDMSDRAKFR